MTRMDRSVSMIVSRLRRGAAGVPILMYHSVSHVNDRDKGPYYATNTTPEVFASHLETLVDLGYRTIDLESVASQQVPERAVVITFDDGYADFLENAMPLLSRRGFSATVFLPVGLIRSPGLFRGRRLLSWNQIRGLRGSGVTWGSHTLTHRPLGDLTSSELGEEIALSKTMLEQEIGAEVACFSYPFAFPEADPGLRKSIRQWLVKSGYRRAVTTRIGTHGRGQDVFAMKRLPANDCDDVALLELKLRGAYDWMHGAQKVYKRAQAALGGLVARRPADRRAG